MIKEDYVSFETAKLLKEKRFPQELGEEGCINTIPYYIQNGVLITCDINTVRQRYYSEAAAPTLQMAMKWLREVHKYLIVVGNKNGNYLYLIKDLRANTDLGISNNEYISYEEACEEAIKYCLENLI